MQGESGEDGGQRGKEGVMGVGYTTGFEGEEDWLLETAKSQAGAALVIVAQEARLPGTSEFQSRRKGRQPPPSGAGAPCSCDLEQEITSP